MAPFDEADIDRAIDLLQRSAASGDSAKAQETLARVRNRGIDLRTLVRESLAECQSFQDFADLYIRPQPGEVVSDSERRLAASRGDTLSDYQIEQLVKQIKDADHGKAVQTRKFCEENGYTPEDFIKANATGTALEFFKAYIDGPGDWGDIKKKEGE